MEKCYLEIKKAQELFDDYKEDELLLICINCKHFTKKENGYYCKDKPIRVIDFN